MNKELIKKYKAEFDHWLNGGKLLIKMSTGWEPVPTDYTWHLTDKLYIINDEYVEFRKASAEGKTIQCNAKEGENDITYTAYGHTWWVDTTEFKYATRFYRVKPEEPKFKVGDWVIDKKRKHKPFMVTSSDLEADSPNYVKIDCELWQPKPGEWCWFWNEPSDIPILAKLISIEYFLERPTEYKIKTPSYISETVYSCMTYMYFKNCEPFIGQLPTNLKDSK